MNLYDAIYKRKSIRKYSNEKLNSDVLNAVSNAVNSAQRLYKDIDLRIHLVEDGSKIQRIMKGVIGNLGKIVAPHFLVITSEAKEGYMENAGFTLEEVVLKLTTMGIATCWLGGHVDEQDLKQALGIAENQTSVVLISFGLPMEASELLRKDSSQVKRKAVQEFVSGTMDEAWQKIMDAVRFAPSAANSQPWQFEFCGDTIHVYCSTPGNFLMKKMLGKINILDMGIALCHLNIAAKHFSKPVEFRRMKLEDRKGNKYITSIVSAP